MSSQTPATPTSSNTSAASAAPRRDIGFIASFPAVCPKVGVVSRNGEELIAGLLTFREGTCILGAIFAGGLRPDYESLGVELANLIHDVHGNRPGIAALCGRLLATSPVDATAILESILSLAPGIFPPTDITMMAAGGWPALSPDDQRFVAECMPEGGLDKVEQARNVPTYFAWMQGWPLQPLSGDALRIFAELQYTEWHGRARAMRDDILAILA